ncbi:DUF115 domain-containing protein [bacterium]|nr:DUF115 domain-containing protein [bacterium]
MSFLEENLRCLEENQPSMAAELRGHSAAARLELSPLDDAIPDVDAIIITGLPAADTWGRLLSSRTPFFIVAHDDLPELKAYLTLVDVTRGLSDHRLCFSVGEEGVLQLLNDLFGTLLRRRVILFGHTEMPVYAAAMKEMQFFDTLCAANRATLDQFAEEWQNNVSDNLTEILRGPFLQDQAGRWRGGHAVVVGAGPSLDQVDLPADFGNAAVVACDTATPVLAARGVTPDVIVTLDSSESNRMYLQNLPDAVYERSILCVTPVVDRSVYRPFRNLLFYSYGHPTLDHLRDSGLPFASLACGGSVALTAIDAVRHFGARQVYLLGCDFQHLPHRAHARGTGAAFRALKSVSRFRPPEMASYDDLRESPDPGRMEGTAGTFADKRFQKWRDWLELYVKNRDLEVHQMSKIAAHIPGIDFGFPGTTRTTPRLTPEVREYSPEIRRELKFLAKELEMALSAPPAELMVRVKALPRVSKCLGYVLAWLTGVEATRSEERLRAVLTRFREGVGRAAGGSAQGR